FVVKAHAFSPAAFVSVNGGPLGWVIENRVTVHALPPESPRFRLEEAGPGGEDPYVPIHRVVLGDDATALRALAGSQPAGLVLEGFGVGHVNRDVADAAGELAARIPVVLATRTGAGTVLTSTYGFDGSERDLLGRGLISARSLNSLKARLLMSLCLRAGYDRRVTAQRLEAWSGAS
ncbi:MAG: asparaginase, partial [Actinomycetota bacterium]